MLGFIEKVRPWESGPLVVVSFSSRMFSTLERKAAAGISTFSHKKNYRVVKGGGSKGRGFPNLP